MNLVDNLIQTYKQGSAAIRLLYVNITVYVLLQVFVIVMRLFNVDGDFIYAFLALPSDLHMLLYRPWTIITYMFLHKEFFHILFNMFALYWFGKLFLMYFTNKQLVSLYFLGGIVAGLFYVVAYNVFPLYSQMSSTLMGASGSIMAVIVATAIQSPNLEMRMLLIGGVKLKYIAIAMVLISFFGITSNNAGGEIAHLGGALSGYFFVVSLRRGKDMTRGFSRLMDSVHNIFKPRKLKVKRSRSAFSEKKMTDEEYNMQKARNMAEIDRILDKIKASGYGSLTAEEKQKLFDQGRK